MRVKLPRAKGGAPRKLEEMKFRELINIFDGEVSYFVRASAVINGNGLTRCVTCDKPMGEITKFDCGHFISREELNTRFDLRNLGPQCTVCNRHHEGRKAVYRQKLIGREGLEAVLEMESKVGKPCFLSHDDLIKSIRGYRAKNKVLAEKMKGI